MSATGTRLVLAGLVWSLALPAGAQTPASSGDAAAPKAAPALGPGEPGFNYVIGPGDVLNLFVWREADLTRDVTVRLDGKISVPLLGDVEAAGKTPQQLGEEITVRLQRFVEAPQVTVSISQSNSRFYVVGQVMKPGDFPLNGPITAVQALAVAGGLKDFAKADSIVIIRRQGGAQSFIAVNYKKLEAGRDATQNVTIRPGDTILVP